MRTHFHLGQTNYEAIRMKETLETVKLFLNCSPLLPKGKCFECKEFHSIGEDLVYCVHCHHPKDIDTLYDEGGLW